jgi:hypothetical protein
MVLFHISLETVHYRHPTGNPQRENHETSMDFEFSSFSRVFTRILESSLPISPGQPLF